MKICKTLILISFIISSSFVFAANEKFYLNGANTTEQQNSDIESGIALVKQNTKKAETIKFNLLYATPQDKSYAICGSFQTINDNRPKRFVISQSNLMVEKTDENIKEDKKFNEVWDNFCE